MGKKVIKIAPRINATVQALLDGAAVAGYNARNAFEAGVDLARAIAKAYPSESTRKVMLASAGSCYMSGHIVAYIERDQTREGKALLKRWDNLDQAARFTEAATIIGKSGAETTKNDRRTALEERAFAAAKSSWSYAKRQAGIAAANAGGRRPRPSSTAPNPVPVDLVKASPTFANKAAANDHFGQAFAALMATVNKNAKFITPQLSTIISVAYAEAKKLGLVGETLKS